MSKVEKFCRPFAWEELPSTIRIHRSIILDFYTGMFEYIILFDLEVRVEKRQMRTIFRHLRFAKSNTYVGIVEISIFISTKTNGQDEESRGPKTGIGTCATFPKGR